MQTSITTLRFDEKIVERLLKIEQECFGGEAWNRQMLVDAYLSNNYCLLGCFCEGELVGDAVLTHADDYGEIATIGVLPEFRRQGIGEALLKELLARALSFGVKTITLEVSVGNEKAFSLYNKYGFCVAAKRLSYYKNSNFGSNDAYIMVLDLGVN